MFDPLKIVQMAAVRIGEEAPQSLDEIMGDDSVELVYNAVVDFCLDLHPWGFNIELRQLSKRAGVTSPILGFTHIYELPTDVVGDPLSVHADLSRRNEAFTHWAMQGPALLASVEPLYANFHVRPHPLRWPGAFREAVILAIAAELAMSMASNDDLRAQLRVNAYGNPSENFRGGAIGVAIRNQAFRTPAKALPVAHNPFSAAWRG
ncbi:hypothetical protein [Ancylobacter oerskovii]|uniref:LuxR family transcriptional regulator n=1 Tax=Ancylobacter oerskovii TaxID=459519 RepID=A0ABW4YRZ3_9HYPH|nr:hypothetical protein [Ancylobacter oerskovii]MBS7545689.1 hypothetical protein [Ancylobacter oerskovii]